MKIQSILIVICLFYLALPLSATTMREKQVTCAVCNQSSSQTVIMSTNSFGYPDLDLRPPEMRRSTMRYWVEKCPHCGYSSASIAKLIKGAKEFVAAKEYKQQIKDSTYTELANKFLAAAMIYKNADNLKSAAWSNVHAAWASDDANQPQNSINCRKKALAVFFLIEKKGDKIFNEIGGLELIITDLLRRSAQFDLAEKYIEKGLALKDLHKVVKKCLLFEKKLIAKKDSEVHTIGEVMKKKKKKKK